MNFSSKNNSTPAAKTHFNSKARNKKLKEIWQLLLLTSISTGLGTLVFKNGWEPISAQQIEIKGNSYLQSKEVLQASGVTFPKPLLQINPKQLEINLLQRLPIKDISIQRRILPPGLEIEILERKAIAFANRSGPNGLEKGMIDKDAYWIPIGDSNQTQNISESFFVEGWLKSHKNLISKIVQVQKNLGTRLEKIILTPNGEVQLQTEKFKLVILGSDSDRLDIQLAVLAHLSESESLSKKFGNEPIKILNLRDPSKPVLKTK